MKWETRYSKYENWKPWFAWFPVYVGGGERAWMCRVERRLCSHIFGAWWEYREIEQT